MRNYEGKKEDKKLNFTFGKRSVNYLILFRIFHITKNMNKSQCAELYTHGLAHIQQ